ncbi:hypothetical protein ['Paenibacillus yunnanensis' Narsing Rao et al. 2020]|uniref:hypothetical protein n=1 Tax=Paenibacillus tengchongensis TaxID=2608684 RepID=UPI0016524887|nr:hypothetical protein [Paenibacillus tengchongensis]
MRMCWDTSHSHSRPVPAEAMTAPRSRRSRRVRLIPAEVCRPLQAVTDRCG